MVQIICILAVATGAILLNDSSLTILLCSLVGTACAATLLWRFGKVGHPVKLTSVLAAGLLLGYCGGTAYTQAAYALSGHDAVAVMGIPNAYVSYALAMAFGACIALLLASFLETAFVSASEVFLVDGRIEVFLWISVALAVMAFSTGDFGFSATNFQPGGGSKLSVLAALAGMTVPAIFPFAALGVVQSKGATRIRLATITVAGILLLLPISRRSVFYSLLVMLWLIARHSGRDFRLTRTRKIFILIALVVLLVVSNLFFVGLRTSAAEGAWREGRRITVAEGLRMAKNGIFNDPGTLLHSVEDNVSDRSFVISYLALLSRAGQSPEPMWGADVIFQLKIATPDVVFRLLHRNKDSIRAIQAEEGLANEHFHLTVTDGANSVLTGGYIDFGLAGVFLYPLLICLALRIVFAALRSFVDHQVMLVAGILALTQLIQTECGLDGYIALVRNTVILAVAYGVLFQGPLPLFFRSFKEAVPQAANGVDADGGSSVVLSS